MRICGSFRGGGLFCPHRRAGQRRDKAVASSRNVRDVRLAIMAVAQSTSQLGDVKAQVALVDGQTGPGFRQKLRFADNFARAADQQAENVKRTTAERSLCAIAFQEASARDDAKRPEENFFRELLDVDRRL